MSTQTVTRPPDADRPAQSESVVARVGRLLLTNRLALLLVLLVLVVGGLLIMSAAGATTGEFNADYMAGALINLVPLAMLALAETIVIISGGGGIDLSVGSTVSLVGMIFGFMYGMWGWPLLVAIIVAVVLGALLGGVNGFLVAKLGFPPLIATLATYYAYWSLALVINAQKPISTKPIQDLFSLSTAVEIPVIGGALPLIPLGVVLFLLPTFIVVWLLLSKTTYGRRLYGVGTNDVASDWSGVNVARTRFLGYVLAGAIAGLVAVVTVSQFASARPDAGTSGNGMALPAITIAVLGGVAVTGGAGRAVGVLLAALLIVWLNAGILISTEGNVGGQIQLLALGLVLVGSALLNILTARKYSGAR